MKKFALYTLLASVTVAFAGCHAGPRSDSSSTELDRLCEQYANAMKAGNIPAAQTATQAINAKNADKSAADQLNWAYECLRKHNLANR